MEQKTVVTSKQFSLDWRDAGRGLVLAVITAVVTTIATMINAGDFTFNWEVIWKTAAAAAFSYLVKKFVEPPVERKPVQPTEKTE